MPREFIPGETYIPRTGVRRFGAVRDIQGQERLALATSEYLQAMPGFNRHYIMDIARERETTPIAIVGEALAIGLEILDRRAVPKEGVDGPTNPRLD